MNETFKFLKLFGYKLNKTSYSYLPDIIVLHYVVEVKKVN